MRRRLALVVLVCSIHTAEATPCPHGTMAAGDRCAPIVDRQIASTTASLSGLPDLVAQRSQAIAPADECRAGSTGAGVWFNDAITITTSSELHTKMIVQPDGAGNTTGCFIFTTSTNRTQRGVEVYMSYGPNNAKPDLAVWDWSCDPAAPCAGNKTTVGNMVSITDLTCYLHEDNDGGGHLQKMLSYVNATRRLDSGTPALWENEVLVYDHCHSAWARIYSHQYRLTNDRGGGWGPIIELYPMVAPPLAELGFNESYIVHDGITTTLDPTITSWSDPPFQVFHQLPNSSYGAGATPGPPVPEQPVDAGVTDSGTDGASGSAAEHGAADGCDVGGGGGGALLAGFVLLVRRRRR